MCISYLEAVDMPSISGGVNLDEERGREEELWAKKKEAKLWQL